MKPDDFEQQLARRPVRSLPKDWRRDILAAARPSQEPAAAKPVLETGSFSWSDWFWPCPQAWAGLAAIWLLIFGLHLAPPSSTLSAQKGSPTSSGTASHPESPLAAQRRELARLLEAPDLPANPAPERKPNAPPGPRSERPGPSKV